MMKIHIVLERENEKHQKHSFAIESSDRLAGLFLIQQALSWDGVEYISYTTEEGLIRDTRRISPQEALKSRAKI